MRTHVWKKDIFEFMSFTFRKCSRGVTQFSTVTEKIQQVLVTPLPGTRVLGSAYYVKKLLLVRNYSATEEELLNAFSLEKNANIKNSKLEK